MTWSPAGRGRLRCDEHGVEFPRGQSCPQCGRGAPPPAPPLPGATIEARAEAMGLPSTLEHEREYTRLAADLEKKAKRAKGLAAVRLYDAALKARRQAHTLCQAREDWARTERLEELVRPRLEGTPTAAAERDSGTSEAN